MRESRSRSVDHFDGRFPARSALTPAAWSLIKLEGVQAGPGTSIIYSLGCSSDFSNVSAALLALYLT